ncbi:ABC transporter substrate-binding protein [Fundicoccus sp. Sow4_H7]|uniref:ABC transporter substrate-binding protein n=1 Tax=Fundicoccus sp. Sow4_H7 TaxID=3438784 RepID=UPI003F91702D
MKKSIKQLLTATTALLALNSTSALGTLAVSAQEETPEPVTLTFFNADLSTDDPFTNPVAQEITRLTGVTLEISHPVGGDEQAVPLMIASGDYPDMIFAKGDINKMIDAGALIPLDDLIEERGDNIKAMYGDQLDRLRNSLDDPQIYHLGTAGVVNRPFKTAGTFQIQFDVLKELGYPEIRTLEDYENALLDYIEKYPEIDGQKTIGLSLLGSDWRWLITVGNPSGFAAGWQDDGQWHVDEETGDTVYKFMTPELKEYFKWLNHMNDIGLLDPESFTQTHDTYISKLSTGRVIGIADQEWNYSQALAVLRQDGKTNRLFAPLPVTLNEDLLSQSNRDSGFTGTTGISITSTSKNQERAFDFLNWMASEEAQILVNWGVEGVNYEIVDGQRVQFEEDRINAETDPNYSINAGIGAYIWPFPQWGNAALDSNGQTIGRDSADAIIENYSADEREALDAYGVDLWIDTFPDPEELGIPAHGRAYEYVIPASSDAAIIQQKADDLTTQRITQAILADPSEFDALWDQMIADLEQMRIGDAEAEMTQLTLDRLELWGNPIE